MSEPPALGSWYGADFDRMLAKGALLAGARHLVAGEHYAAYSRLKQAEAAVDRDEARRIRGLIHAAAAGVKVDRGDARGAVRQLERARVRLAEGAPALASVDAAALLELLRRRVEQARG